MNNQKIAFVSDFDGTISDDDFFAYTTKAYFDNEALVPWRACRDKGVPLYVCSAGNDYYIRRLIGSLIDRYGVTLVSNTGGYSPETGPVMTAPDQSSPYFDADVGISKRKLVEKLKRDGYFVVFAGDGPPDVAPAEIADAVFARPKPHGIQVGVATYLCALLQENGNRQDVASVLNNTGFWDFVAQNPFDWQEFEQALKQAPSIKRDYYTALSEPEVFDRARRFLDTDAILQKVIR